MLKKGSIYTFKKIVLFIILLLAFQQITTQEAQAEDKLKTFRNMWKNGRYSEVLPLLQEFRKKPNGRSPEIDYMIATSSCRIPQLREQGVQQFSWILQHYSLDKDSNELVKQEQHSCKSINRVNRSIPDFIVVRTHRGGRVRGNTKIFFLNREDVPITSPVEIIKEIPPEELANRLFKVSDRKAGVTQVTKLLGAISIVARTEPLTETPQSDNPPGISRGSLPESPQTNIKPEISYGPLEALFENRILSSEQYKTQFHVESTGKFILASSNIEPQLLSEMARNLDKVLQFYASQYNMSIPPYLITIYLVPDTQQLQELAGKIHGIKVAQGSIGYSIEDDLSVVAKVPSSKFYGTVAHELFHLMLRNNFGDAPPWIDEGIASLYEEAQIDVNKIVGVPNFRGRVLHDFWELRPSIVELIKMNWSSFDTLGEVSELERQAANHATARYLILYLQSKNKLTTVFNAFHQRTPTDTKIDPGVDAVKLFESIMQKSVTEVDKDFTKWFNNLPSHRNTQNMIPNSFTPNSSEEKAVVK